MRKDMQEMSIVFGPIRQLGYVVRDIERAMRYWTVHLGVGPFFYYESAPTRDFEYRGKSCKAQTSAALAQSGSLQIELLQPRDDLDSPYVDFLRSGREGLQHVAFWTETFDADLSQALKAGFEPVLTGYTIEPNGRFVYFSDRAVPHPGAMVELSSLSPGKKRAFDRVAEAAAGWDGSDPVRRLD